MKTKTHKTKARRPDMPPIHPGEILAEDFMKPLGITQYRLARNERARTPHQ